MTDNNDKEQRSNSNSSRRSSMTAAGAAEQQQPELCNPIKEDNDEDYYDAHSEDEGSDIGSNISDSEAGCLVHNQVWFR